MKELEKPTSRKRNNEDEPEEEATRGRRPKVEGGRMDRKRKEAPKDDQEDDEEDVRMVGLVVEGDGAVKRNGFYVNEEVNTVEDSGSGGEEEDPEGGWCEAENEVKKLTKEARKEEVEYIVKKLEMFEFGSREEAMRRGGKEPTTTKWVEGMKEGDDGE